MHKVKCTKCGLSGTIAIPDTESRGTCPRCRKEPLPLDQWQQYGFGALIPETPTKKIVSATITAVETEVKVDEDALTDLESLRRLPQDRMSPKTRKRS